MVYIIVSVFLYVCKDKKTYKLRPVCFMGPGVIYTLNCLVLHNLCLYGHQSGISAGDVEDMSDQDRVRLTS